MYILWNSIKNLARNKGRHLLMAVIIFAIIFTTVISIMINSATISIIADYKTRFGNEAYIAFDYQKMQEMYDAGEEMNTPPLKQQLSYSDSELLSGSFSHTNTIAILQNLHVLDEDGYKPPMNDGASTIEYLDGNATLAVTSNITKYAWFKDHTIVEGRMFEDLNECIISDELAALNNGLAVGDTIVVDGIIKGKPMPYELTISGVYHDSRTAMEKDQTRNIAIYNAANEIFISTNTAVNMELFDGAELFSIFYLKDREQLAVFEQELAEKGFPNYMALKTDEEGYRRIVGPVEDLARISTTFLIVVVVLGSLILLVLSTLAMRERKYEIGVLLAMGMTKAKTALGLLLESLFIACVCLFLGLGIGAAAAQPVADYLLENQTTMAQAEQSVPLYTGPVIEDEYTIEVFLDQKALLQIALITLAITLPSSLIGILYITRYEPMRILSERN